MHSTLSQLLITAGLVSKQQLERAEKSLKDHGGGIGRRLIEMGYIAQETLAEFVATHYSLPFVNLDQLEINRDAIKLISPEVAQKFILIPIFKTEKDLSIAFSDPTDTATINTIEFMTGLSVIPFAARETDIKKAITAYYPLYNEAA
jgi:type IV pilus assembly protein PilB